VGGKKGSNFSAFLQVCLPLNTFEAWYKFRTTPQYSHRRLLPLSWFLHICFIYFCPRGKSRGFHTISLKHEPLVFTISQSDLLRIAQILFKHVHKTILHFPVRSDYLISSGDGPYLLISSQISFSNQINQFCTKTFASFSFRHLRIFQTLLLIQNILFYRGTAPIHYLKRCHTI
jgi:hypothetical protein